MGQRQVNGAGERWRIYISRRRLGGLSTTMPKVYHRPRKPSRKIGDPERKNSREGPQIA